MNASTGHASVEGGRLYYERAGEGFPVVLIHGGLWDLRMWDDQFEAFAEHHDVIRYDVRGYGRSDVPSAPYSDLRDLRYLLGELGVTRCAIVGCSMGGQLALDFALEFPDLVDGVVPVSPGLSGYAWTDGGLDALLEAVDAAVAEGDLRGAMAYELAVWTPAGDDPAVDARIREIAMDNLHIFRVPDLYAEGPPSPALPHLAELQAATLVVVGEQDLGEIHAIADTIVEAVPGAHKDVIAGGDHLVNMRKPERFNRIVLDFLSWRG
jgi:pimeloyl-ACP methyl ester carboxylesterase